MVISVSETMKTMIRNVINIVVLCPFMERLRTNTIDLVYQGTPISRYDQSLDDAMESTIQTTRKKK